MVILVSVLVLIATAILYAVSNNGKVQALSLAAFGGAVAAALLQLGGTIRIP